MYRHDVSVCLRWMYLHDVYKREDKRHCVAEFFFVQIGIEKQFKTKFPKNSITKLVYSTQHVYHVFHVYYVYEHEIYKKFVMNYQVYHIYQQFVG